MRWSGISPQASRAAGFPRSSNLIRRSDVGFRKAYARPGTENLTFVALPYLFIHLPISQRAARSFFLVVFFRNSTDHRFRRQHQ
jgi:hypothetical protein